VKLYAVAHHIVSMIKFLFIFLLCLASNAILAQRDYIKKLQKGRIKEDTSFVYWLPYEEGVRKCMVQGYYSSYSHKTDIANDFKMRTGTKVCAARGGVVTYARGDSDKGGLKNENMADWNYIFIRHDDGSTAIYAHLKKDGVLVKEGDTIKQGQHTGYSGNTGYSAFPHLHFEVSDASGKQIPVRFLTKKGPRYLRPLRWYKSVRP
jgi:murein DD-endopeptidase MepM/ murein hydrolase activator NlpD